MITYFGTLICIFFHAFRSKRIILSENALLKKENDRIGQLASNTDKLHESCSGWYRDMQQELMSSFKKSLGTIPFHFSLSSFKRLWKCSHEPVPLQDSIRGPMPSWTIICMRCSVQWKGKWENVFLERSSFSRFVIESIG